MFDYLDQLEAEVAKLPEGHDKTRLYYIIKSIRADLHDIEHGEAHS